MLQPKNSAQYCIVGAKVVCGQVFYRAVLLQVSELPWCWDFGSVSRVFNMKDPADWTMGQTFNYPNILSRIGRVLPRDVPTGAELHPDVTKVTIRPYNKVMELGGW